MRQTFLGLSAAVLLGLQGCGGTSDSTVSSSSSGAIRGGLCGVPGLVGERRGDVSGRMRGCGIDNAVSVTRVAGVSLTQPAVMNCQTARALHNWVERGAKPAVGRTGGGIASLRVAAHYSCRTVNSRRGGKVSEHGKGRAIDISAINLRDGSAMTVLGGYNSGRHRGALRKMYRAACGPFSTTLGPGSDRYHQDHFHFDTAQRGSYCR